jgi:hypothetical protein
VHVFIVYKLFYVKIIFQKEISSYLKKYKRVSFSVECVWMHVHATILFETSFIF